MLDSRQDGAEGGAGVGGQGAPVQDAGEGGGRGAEEPDQACVDAGQGDGRSGECFPQVFQPVGREQRPLKLRRAGNGVQIDEAGGSVTGSAARSVARSWCTTKRKGCMPPWRSAGRSNGSS
jgi:hypothetical protein